jgi:hypothetical protein
MPMPTMHTAGHMQYVSIDSVDYVNRIGNITTRTAHPGCRAYSFCIGKK